jgi:glycosyltransferase involved in cell wall biosynthesis
MALGASVLLDIPFSFSTYVDFEHNYEYKLLNEKMRMADFVVACTQYCQNRLVQLTAEQYRSKIPVIHSSLDPAYSRNHSPQSQAERVGILSVARFVEKKGIKFLVLACALLKERGCKYDCLLIGEGPEKINIEKMIKDFGLSAEVTLIDPLPNDRVMRYYGESTIIVMPCVNAQDGERDGIPNVLLEAMSCGSPVVATNISGIPELIEDGENGLLVPEKDEVSLATAIEKILNSENLRKKLSENGRNTVKTKFNLYDKSKMRWDFISSWQAPASLNPEVNRKRSTCE